MRLPVVCALLLLPLGANAASVLLIPVDPKARAIADELIEPFRAAKLTVKMAGPGSPALNCLKDADRNGCLGKMGVKAKVEAVFVVSGAFVRGKATLTIEMLHRGVVLNLDSYKVTKGKVKTQMKASIAALLKLVPKTEPTAPVEQPVATVTPVEPEPTEEPAPVEPEPVKVVEAPKPPEPVVDAPKKPEPVVLTPTRPPEPVVIKTTPLRPKKPKVAAWVVTGLAIAAAGTAATFGGLGLADKGRLESAPDGASTMSYNDATALQQKANLELTVALGTGIGAGVGGVLAAILWGAE